MKIVNKYMTYMYNDGITYYYEDYDYKFTKKSLEEHEKSLWRLYRYLEDNDYDLAEDIYNLGDVINLIIGLKEEIK